MVAIEAVVHLDGVPHNRAESPDYAPRSPPGVPVDVFVYTPQEQECWTPRFRREVERGLRLYERR